MKNIDIKELLGKAKTQYKKYNKIAECIFFFVLVGVVIYGMTKGVYNGFAAPVPFFIIMIFVAMAFIRLYQWIDKPQDNKTSESDEQKDSDESEI